MYEVDPIHYGLEREEVDPREDQLAALRKAYPDLEFQLENGIVVEVPYSPSEDHETEG